MKVVPCSVFSIFPFRFILDHLNTMVQDLEEALGVVAIKDGIPDVKFSKVMFAYISPFIFLNKD